MSFETSRIRRHYQGRVAASLRFGTVYISVAFVLVMATRVGLGQQIGRLTVQSGASLAAGVYAIRNARVVTVSGPEIENGTVILRNGKIEAVGGTVSIPPGAQEIDAHGLSVYPGMIDAGTSLGLVEVEGGASGTVDVTEVGEMNPNVQAIVAVNAHSAHVGVSRVNGITSVLTLPRGGIIAGQAALVNLFGSTPREMAVNPFAALVINFPRAGTPAFAVSTEAANISEAMTARDRQIEQLRKLLRDAEAYGRAQDAYTHDRHLPPADQNAELAALVPYVRGERPVLMTADREMEIRAAVRFADEMHLKAIIVGGDDAWKTATLLKDHDVPVILTGVLDLPLREDDYYDSLFENASKLQKAGVRFCISTGDTGAHVRDLPYHAGMAAAFGLPPVEALKSVTLYPAQIMNVADRLGSIEPGKMANLVITDGDLLDARTHVRYLFIEGREVPLTSRHTQLYEQFKDRR